jgi:hypothetical protein
MTYFYFTCFLFIVIILYIGGCPGGVVVGFTTNETDRNDTTAILLKVASYIYIERKQSVYYHFLFTGFEYRL